MRGGGTPSTEDYSGDGDNPGRILTELLLISASGSKEENVFRMFNVKKPLQPLPGRPLYICTANMLYTPGNTFSLKSKILFYTFSNKPTNPDDCVQFLCQVLRRGVVFCSFYSFIFTTPDRT